MKVADRTYIKKEKKAEGDNQWKEKKGEKKIKRVQQRYKRIETVRVRKRQLCVCYTSDGY